MLNKELTTSRLLILSLAIVCCMFLVFLFSPNRLGDSSKVVKLYFADNISPAHRAVIDMFNKKYAGEIQVLPVNLPFEKFSTNERKQLLARAFRSRTNSIDIFAVDLFWIPRFAKWCEPLSRYFSREEQEKFTSYALKTCFWGDTLACIPLYVDVGILYYRRDLLRQLPDFGAVEKKLKESMTWKEFIGLSRFLPNRDRPFYLFPADNYEGLVCSFVETLAGQKTSLIENHKLNLNTPEARAGLGLLVDLVQHRQLTPEEVTEFREVDCYRYAFEHDALFFRGWPGNLEPYKDEYPAKARHVGVAALPHFEGHEPVSVLGGWNLMISKYSTHKKEAVKFLKFISSPEMQKVIYETMGYLPTNKEVYNDMPFVREHPELTYYAKLLARGFHRPSDAEYTKISDIISFYIKEAIKGNLTVRRALQLADERVHSNKVLIN